MILTVGDGDKLAKSEERLQSARRLARKQTGKTSEMRTPKTKILFLGEREDAFSMMAHEQLVSRGLGVQAEFSSRGDGNGISQEVMEWNGDYILSLRCYHLLPQELLDRARIAALNFHPAPPEYPGSGSCNWALYNGDTEFGVTLHHMNARIDVGDIIEVRRYPILPEDTLDTLVQRSREHAYDFFVETVERLLSDNFDFETYLESRPNGERWAGKAQKISAIDRLQTITPTISQEELERIVRATHTEKFPVRLRLHGRLFRLEN